MITYRRLGKLGYFGNQLFEVAGTTLYARKFGYHVAFPHWTGCDVFTDMRGYTKTEYLHSRFLPIRHLDDMRSFHWWEISKKLYSLPDLYKHPEDNISLYGYMQDPLSLRLLIKHKAEILKLFRFRDEIESSYRALIKPYEPFVALHVRRGDFVRLGYALPTSYYHDLLRKIQNGRNLYVSSNDPAVTDELKDFTPFKLKNPLPHVPDFVFDFWMIHHAQTVVGCGSTFSWWAAYLGNKNDYYSPPLTHLWKKGETPGLAKLDI